MPTLSRRKRASASSSSALKSAPATSTRPELARSRPPSTIIKVDLPEPEGPTSPTAAPASMRSEIPRSTLTAPAALGSVRRTSSSRISGFSMFSRHMRQGLGYGRGGAFVNRRPVLALITLLLGTAPLAFIPGAAAAAGATRIRAFGDSLTAGFGLAPQDGFTAQLAARLKTDGYAVEVINAGVSGD